MTNLTTLPSPENKNLLLSVNELGELISCSWIEGDKTTQDIRAENIATTKVSMFSENHLDMRKTMRLCDSLDAKSKELCAMACDLEEKHGVGTNYPEYIAASERSSECFETERRAREWLMACRPVTLTECARQMKYALARQDLMLNNGEFDALERASVIVARLASYVPNGREKELAA